jgi:hypothetical protein
MGFFVAVVNITGGKFAISVVDTGDNCTTSINNTPVVKFLIIRTSATGDNDTSGKFATCINDAGGKFPPVSTSPVGNNGNHTRLPTPYSEYEEKI